MRGLALCVMIGQMKLALSIAQILAASLLIGAILLQAKGGGLSSVFGGIGGSYHSRRGVEKILWYTTIILAALFLSLTLINVIFV